MGAPMAANLAEWLHQNSMPALTLWNRTASKLPAESESIAHAGSIKELAEKCDIIITSLANDDVANEVYEQLFEGVKAKKQGGGNTIFVETSTLYPLTAGESPSLWIFGSRDETCTLLRAELTPNSALL